MNKWKENIWRKWKDFWYGFFIKVITGLRWCKWLVWHISWTCPPYLFLIKEKHSPYLITSIKSDLYYFTRLYTYDLIVLFLFGRWRISQLPLKDLLLHLIIQFKLNRSTSGCLVEFVAVAPYFTIVSAIDTTFKDQNGHTYWNFESHDSKPPLSSVFGNINNRDLKITLTVSYFLIF